MVVNPYPKFGVGAYCCSLCERGKARNQGKRRQVLAVGSKVYPVASLPFWVGLIVHEADLSGRGQSEINPAPRTRFRPPESLEPIRRAVASEESVRGATV